MRNSANGWILSVLLVLGACASSSPYTPMPALENTHYEHPQQAPEEEPGKHGFGCDARDLVNFSCGDDLVR